MQLPHVGIVGSGFMGQEIGKYLCEKGYPVLLKGRKQADLDTFLKATDRILGKQKKRGKITQEAFEARLADTQGTLNFDDRFASLDLIIESVVEDLDVKKEIFPQIEAACSDDTVLCTNTSVLSIAQIAETLRKNDRVVGLHFFHPVKFSQIVEIIPTSTTSLESIQAASALAAGMGKKVLKVKDSPGFFFNRIMITNLAEAYLALESGAGTITQIDEMFRKSDFIIGPLSSSDVTGLDVIYHSLSYIAENLPERFTVPRLITDMLDKGRLGKKVGKGFYNYDGNGSGDAEMAVLLEEHQGRRTGAAPPPFSPMQSLYRTLNEAMYCLEEGIVCREEVEEIITVVPPFYKGLFRYLDTVGLDRILQDLLELEQAFGGRFRPPAILSDLVRDGHTGVNAGTGFFDY